MKCLFSYFCRCEQSRLEKFDRLKQVFALKREGVCLHFTRTFLTNFGRRVKQERKIERNK